MVRDLRNFLRRKQDIEVALIDPFTSVEPPDGELFDVSSDAHLHLEFEEDEFDLCEDLRNFEELFVLKSSHRGVAGVLDDLVVDALVEVDEF